MPAAGQTFSITLKKTTSYNSIRKKVLEASLRMAEAGLVVSMEGNASARIPGEEKIAITPSQIPYDRRKLDDILIVGFDGNVLLGKHRPSAETKTHISVYKARSDAGGVIHTHSLYASALSCIDGRIPPLLEGQTIFLGGDIGTAPYALEGTGKLGANAVEALRERDGTMLSNHGTICCGKTIDDALRNAILLEKLAMIYIMAKAVGEVRPIPADITELQNQYYKSRREGVPWSPPPQYQELLKLIA